MDEATECTREPRLRIKGFRPWRDASVLAALVALFVLGIAAGYWDYVVTGFFLSLFLGAKFASRVEWRGRSLLSSLGPSVFEQGWRALPRDVLVLTIIAVSFPASAITYLLLQENLVAWIALGNSIAVSIAALIALALELRRRSR